MTITAGPIDAPSPLYPPDSYPDFVEGQVLSHIDLNLLRNFLNGRFEFENRAMLGFGVACGLDGETDGEYLRIGDGFALAQGGRLLRREEEYVIALERVPEAAERAADDERESFRFIDAEQRGFTAVLVPDDTRTSAGGKCDADACTTHTDMWQEASQIEIVRGRLATPEVSDNPAAAFPPLAISIEHMPTADEFDRLRDGLADLLSELLPAAAITLLRNLELNGPVGVDVMKIGLVNEVLYSAWEYYRCRSYDTADCYGPDGRPAVALGWLDPGLRAWDCSYRHHFVLAKALERAISGYRCVDLCGEFLDHILQVLRDFTPPVVPPAGQPGNKEPQQATVTPAASLSIKNPKGLAIVDRDLFQKTHIYSVTFTYGAGFSSDSGYPPPGYPPPH